MIPEEITESDFKAYVQVQDSGRFNMMMDARSAAWAARLTTKAYMAIIENYDALCAKYPNVVKGGA